MGLNAKPRYRNSVISVAKNFREAGSFEEYITTFQEKVDKVLEQLSLDGAEIHSIQFSTSNTEDGLWLWMSTQIVAVYWD